MLDINADEVTFNESLQLKETSWYGYEFFYIKKNYPEKRSVAIKTHLSGHW